METKNIKQKVIFKGTPKEVYNLLMDSKKHSEFTGDTAKISNKIGGKFNTYGDYIKGTNLELIPGKKIVQTWRASDWENGHFSKVTFLFKPLKTGTVMEFKHENVPASETSEIKKGWIDFYWKPMKKILGK